MLRRTLLLVIDNKSNQRPRAGVEFGPPDYKFSGLTC